MEILRFVLPIFALAIALLSLFTDTKGVSGVHDIFDKPKILSLVILIFLSAVFSVVYAEYKENEHGREIEAKDAKIEELLDLTKNIDEQLSEGFKAIEATMRRFGVLSPGALSLEETEKVLKADKLRTEIISASTRKNDRRNIAVQYFPKDVDGDKVIEAMKELDFDMTVGTPKYPNHSTNAIYHGGKVDEESVKLVALTLMRAGVSIQGIFKFENDDNREHLIQVVHSGKATPATEAGVRQFLGL